MNKAVNYTVGFLSGALLGSVAALLFAPENGSDIRDTITYRFSSYMDDLNNLINRIAEEKRGISDAQKEGDKVVKDARQRAQDLIKEAEDLLNSIEETQEDASATNGQKTT